MSDEYEKTKEMLQRIQSVLPATVDHETLSMIISWIVTGYRLTAEEVRDVLLRVLRHQVSIHESNCEASCTKENVH